MAIKAIMVGIVRGIAVVLIAIYTIGFSLVAIRVVLPEKFLVSTMICSVAGLPPLLIIQEDSNEDSSPSI